MFDEQFQLATSHSSEWRAAEQSKLGRVPARQDGPLHLQRPADRMARSIESIDQPPKCRGPPWKSPQRRQGRHGRKLLSPPIFASYPAPTATPPSTPPPPEASRRSWDQRKRLILVRRIHDRFMKKLLNGHVRRRD